MYLCTGERNKEEERNKEKLTGFLYNSSVLILKLNYECEYKCANGFVFVFVCM